MDAPLFIAPELALQGCELCHQAGGLMVAQGAHWHVVRVADEDFPAFYRVIWRAHVAEFSELDGPARLRCMEVVARVEQVLRDRLHPTKINLASLGNRVPHLHWHVIARFDWDSHFPQAVWGPRQRSVTLPAAQDRLATPLLELDSLLRQALLGL